MLFSTLKLTIIQAFKFFNSKLEFYELSYNYYTSDKVELFIISIFELYNKSSTKYINYFNLSSIILNF